jgi:uncharacterized membrane protein
MTPASVAKHPIHPMLVAIPIGLWLFTIVADLAYLFRLGGVGWKQAALYTIGAGIVGALLAAVPGLIDFLSITDRRVRKIGLTHMVVNLIAVTLFAVSFWLRLGDPLGGTPVALAVVGFLVLGLGGWLGGELVFVHGMGVEAVDRALASRSNRDWRRKAS